MVANPYTMVPQALEKTRLTLRDIMNDYVGQKIQESKVKLALAEIGAEREAIELEGEKQRLRTGLDLAKIASQERYQEKRLGLEEQRLGEIARGRKATGELTALKAETERRKQAALEKEQNWLNEEKTVEDWAETAGLSPTQKEIFLSSYPAGTSMRRRDLHGQIQDLRKNPVMNFKFALLGNIDRMQALNEELKNPKLTPNQKKILEAQYDTLYTRTNNLKRLVDYMDKGKKKLTPKELSEIKYEAMDNWEGSPDDVKKRYGNDYRKFEKAFVDDYLDTLSRGSLNLEELKRKAGKEPAKEDYSGIMNKLNELEGMKPRNVNIDMIKQQVGKKINAGDIKGANNLIDRHLKNAQKAAKKKEKISPFVGARPARAKKTKQGSSVGPEEHVPRAATKEELDTLSLQKQMLSPADKIKIKEQAEKIKEVNPGMSDQQARVEAELDFIRKREVVSIKIPALEAGRKKILEQDKVEHKRRAREHQRTINLKSIFR